VRRFNCNLRLRLRSAAAFHSDHGIIAVITQEIALFNMNLKTGRLSYWNLGNQFTGVWRILDLPGFVLWSRSLPVMRKPGRSPLVTQKTPVSSSLLKQRLGEVFKSLLWSTSGGESERAKIGHHCYILGYGYLLFSYQVTDSLESAAVQECSLVHSA
jgi:hypothetical protein